MKSRLFSRGYDHLVFSHKRYERYMQSELNDEALSPAADYYDSEIMNLIVQDENQKTEQKTPAPLVKYTVAPQKELFILPSGKFQDAWKSFHPRVIKRIANFLPLRSIVALMETCKDFYAEFGDSIWEERLEKRLKIAIKQRPALPDQEFIKNLHKTQQFSLHHHRLMGSHLLAQTGKIGTLTLTRDIVDFQPIKSLGLLERLRIFAPQNITISLFLSHDVEKNEITLWTNPERNHEMSTLRIRKLQFSQEKQIVSCKFINEECFIVQLKEVEATSEEISCNYEILIFDIYAELVRIENLANDQPTLSNHKIRLNYKSTPETPVTPIQNQDDLNLSDLEIHGKAPSEFSFALDSQGKILFFGQSQGGENLTTLLIYDTKAGKLEKIHSFISKVPLLTIQIPHNKDSLEIFLIYDDLKIEILKYSATEKTFSSQELNYLEKEQESLSSQVGEEQEEITNFHKYRYGSFKNRDGKTVEYLVTLHNKNFYFINLESKSAHRLLTLTKRAPENLEDKTILESVNLMDWNTHENMLVMTIDYLTLVTVVLDSNGQILELVKDSNLLVPFARMPKAPRSDWPTFGNILQTRMPPLIVFNNSYLIIINFPYVEQSFQIYIIPFQSYLVWKGLANFEYKSFRANLEKVFWEVRSPDIFEKDSLTFFKKINNSLNLPDLVKFEDNKLLIKLNINLFFDLQSQTNLQRFSNQYKANNEANKLDISISEQLYLLTSTIAEGKNAKHKKKEQASKNKNHLVFFNSNPNHQLKNQLGTEDYKPDGGNSYYRGNDVNQLVQNKYRRKKSFEETKKYLESSEEDEKKEIQKSGKKKDEYKKTVKYLISKEGGTDRYEYTKSQGLSYYKNTKEYFLKKINQKKDDKKKLRRREDSV